MERWTNEQFKDYLIKSTKRGKYFNKKTLYKDMLFDSTAEAIRYSELEILEKSGQISDLKRQVTFNLIPKNDTEKALNFKIDFTYVENGKNIAEDKKSEMTRKLRDYINKRKLFKVKYQEWEFRES